MVKTQASLARERESESYKKGHALLAKSGEKRVRRGRGSYKFLQYLTLPTKAQMSGVTFHFFGQLSLFQTKIFS